MYLEFFNFKLNKIKKLRLCVFQVSQSERILNMIKTQSQNNEIRQIGIEGRDKVWNGPHYDVYWWKVAHKVNFKFGYEVGREVRWKVRDKVWDDTNTISK